MISARAGEPFEAVLQGATPGLIGTLGVRVIDPTLALSPDPEANIVVPRTTLDIVETPEGSGIYVAALVAPAGTYLVVWDDGAEPPVFASEELVVEAAEALPLPPPSAPPWAPSVQEVADVTPAYTRGGFDDDREDAGAMRMTYTEFTEPTYADVEGLILGACEEVAGRVGVAVPLKHYGLARSTAKWHVAMSISAGKQPADTDDASGEYRGHVANFRACLDELVRLVRLGPTRLA